MRGVAEADREEARVVIAVAERDEVAVEATEPLSLAVVVRPVSEQPMRPITKKPVYPKRAV